MGILKEKDRVFKNLDGKNHWGIEQYKKTGGYVGLDNVLSRFPAEIIASIQDCNMQGRGGAGFSTALKWSYMPEPSQAMPNYLICNADEGEPGTSKDRQILLNDPHTLVEGIIIASHTLQVKTCYVYIRGEYIKPAERLEQAINEAKQAGLLNDLQIHIHKGAGGYICGEETALIESLEGNKGQPRIKPPFPTQQGLYNCPTVVNNVETLAQIGFIIKHNSKALTKIFTISGDVNKPCNIELPLGIKLKDIIEKYAGGVKGGWDNLQAIIPGGSSSQLLTKQEAENINADYESLKQAGSTLGTAGIIVISNDTDLKKVMLSIAKFYKNETCGKCAPCREGMPWVYRDLNDLINNDCSKEKIAKLEKLTKKIEGKTICAFADGAVWPIQSFLNKFADLLLTKK